MVTDSAPKPEILTPRIALARMNVLFYGPQGIGKTKLAGEAQDIPEMAPVLYLNIEGGAMTLAGRKDISFVTVTSTKQLEQVFWALAHKAPGYDQFKTVIIDSISELQTIALEEINARVIEIDKSKGRNPREPDDIYQDDYGVATVRLKRLLRWFRDWPGHTLYTALPRELYPRGQDGQGQPIEVSPALSTALREAVMGYMDHVWYMFEREDIKKDEDGNETGRDINRFMLTRTRGIYRAKTRGDRFAPALGTYYKLDEGGGNLPKLYQKYLETEGGEVQPTAKQPK